MNKKRTTCVRKGAFFAMTDKNLTMLTDFYEFTMAHGYFEKGIADRRAYFDMFFRRVPDGGGYAIMAGVEQLIDYFKNLHFTDEDIKYLRGRGCFSEAFLHYLRHFKFECDVWAVPEGTPVFPGEPLVTVAGPMIQAQFVETMVLLCEEENDPDLIPEAETATNAVAQAVDELQLMTLLNGEYDKNNAIITFHAGTGGTEAQDWADMLFRMYNRWGNAHGYKVSTLDYQDGDEAGLKSASILVEGPNAYGMLKSEHGVHRLVRVSPFDSQSRRQTSFASLEVMPEMDDSIQVDIRPEDVEMQVFRASGAGGQHINKTSSAVRLIHKPTGIVVSCQTERSQFQNRETAMKMLASKLYQIKEQEHLDKISDIKGVQKEIAWGHQIRSYVFMPYTLVKDHRTGFESGNVQAVMDGDLDGFINAYLKASSRGELQAI